MKKVIIVCLLFCGCSKNDNENIKPSSSMSFNDGVANKTYTGSHPIGSAIGLYYWDTTVVWPLPLKYEWIIGGGNSSSDYLAITFFTSTSNLTDSTLSEAVSISYMLGDKFYSSEPLSHPSIHITSLQNNLLNGTFSGILSTIDNSDIMTITNGQLVDVPFSSP